MRKKSQRANKILSFFVEFRLRLLFFMIELQKSSCLAWTKLKVFFIVLPQKKTNVKNEIRYGLNVWVSLLREKTTMTVLFLLFQKWHRNLGTNDKLNEATIPRRKAYDTVIFLIQSDCFKINQIDITGRVNMNSKKTFPFSVNFSVLALFRRAKSDRKKLVKKQQTKLRKYAKSLWTTP